MSKIIIEIDLGNVPIVAASIAAGMLKAQFAHQFETLPKGTKIKITVI